MFKLFLLEKRVIFFGSPVKPVCSLIIAITSLHPQLLTHGLNEAAISKKISFEKPSSFLNAGNVSTNQIDATVPQIITKCVEPTDDLPRRKDTLLPSKKLSASLKRDLNDLKWFFNFSYSRRRIFESNANI